MKSLHSQRGQSMAEFIVAMIVLLPCFIIIPLLYKYGDLAITTTEASRFAAFEFGMYGGDNGNTNFMFPTFRVNKGTYDQDQTTSKMEDDLEKYFYKDKKKWLDHKDKSLVKHVTLTSAQGYFSSFPYAKNGGYSQSFSLNWDHHRTSFVSATLADLPWDVDFVVPKLKIERRTVIGFNGFDAPSPENVSARLVGNPPLFHLGRCRKLQQDDCSHSLNQVFNGNDDTDDDSLDIQPLRPFVDILEKVKMPTIWNNGNPEIVPADRLQ